MRYFLFITIQVLLLYFNTAVAQNYSLTFEHSFIVETDEYFFSTVSLMEKTQDQIFLIDGSKHRIFSFDKEEFSFQNSWGQSGRGPGDFNQIFAADSRNNTLYILDRMLARITSKDSESGDLNVIQLRTADVNTTGIGFLENGNILLVNGGYPNPEIDPIIHLFNNITEELLPIPIFASSMFDLSVPIENRFGHTLSFRMDRIGKSDRFILRNRVFNGVLYEISLENQQLTTFSNVTVPDPPYKEFDPDSGLEMHQSGLPGLIISSGRSGRFVYQMTSNSIAMSSNDRFVVHLRSVNKQMDTEYFLDLFEHDGTHLNTMNITNILNSARYVSDILLLSDNHLIFSFVDKNDDYPKVEMYRLNIL